MFKVNIIAPDFDNEYIARTLEYSYRIVVSLRVGSNTAYSSMVIHKKLKVFEGHKPIKVLDQGFVDMAIRTLKDKVLDELIGAKHELTYSIEDHRGVRKNDI